MHGLATLLGSSALVLKELTVNPDGPGYVRIVGRRAGIVGWFLSLIGIDTSTTFNIMEKRIDYVESSLSGRISHSYPMSSVSNIGTGFTNPIAYLFIAGFLVFMSLSMMLGGGDGSGMIGFLLLIVAGIFGVLYFLRKAMTLFIQVHSGSLAIMVVKKSLIEGVNLDETQANQIIAILVKLIEASH